MLENYEKFRLVDVYGLDTGIHIEVNWLPEDEKSNKCQVLKIILPDKTEKFIRKEMLLQLLWVIGSETERPKMIPQKLTTIRNYSSFIGVKATKDIRKGEMINFEIKIPIPSQEQEIIGDLVAGKRKLIGKS